MFSLSVIQALCPHPCFVRKELIFRIPEPAPPSGPLGSLPPLCASEGAWAVGQTPEPPPCMLLGSSLLFLKNFCSGAWTSFAAVLNVVSFSIYLHIKVKNIDLKLGSSIHHFLWANPRAASPGW